MNASIFVFICACSICFPVQAKVPRSLENPNRSAGCGLYLTGTGKFTPEEIRVFNRNRTYQLRIPANYNPDRAYPLIFRWHGAGGNGLSGGMDIEFSAGNDAIIVSPDGLNKTWNANTDDEDLLLNIDSTEILFNTDPVNLQFFDRILEKISRQYCIDHNRIYSYGFSAGGFFSNLLACERGDILRANAAIAGGPRGGNCKGKVASWFLHDLDDTVVPIKKGLTARDRALLMNDCSSRTIDAGTGCVKYLGCESAPVIWCESKGYGHNIRGDFAPTRVWKFFLDLDKQPE